MTTSIPVLDTHTGGEITRIVLASDLGVTAPSAKCLLDRFRDELDWLRRSLTHEPRGSEFAVGAVVSTPTAVQSVPQVVFFNNVGYLGMCGHGLIGVVEALRYLDLIQLGTHKFDTPVGSVSATLDQEHHVSFTGVQSMCFRKDVAVTIDNATPVFGDVAYGGNWFFIARDDSVMDATADELLEKSTRIRDAISAAGITGAGGAEVDHVELYSPIRVGPLVSGVTETGPTQAQAGCRNFVLCPGGHYDRSPCGTGTSAKLACLAAHGELAPDTEWIQESITGSRFIARYRPDGDGVRVTVRGRAHVIAETKQVFDESDPLRLGRPN